LYASVAQQPTELGRIAVQNAVKVAEGKKGTKSVMVPVKVVTKENVAASAADEATGKGEEAGGRCCQGARGLLGWLPGGDDSPPHVISHHLSGESSDVRLRPAGRGIRQRRPGDRRRAAAGRRRDGARLRPGRPPGRQGREPGRRRRPPRGPYGPAGPGRRRRVRQAAYRLAAGG